MTWRYPSLGVFVLAAGCGAGGSAAPTSPATPTGIASESRAAPDPRATAGPAPRAAEPQTAQAKQTGPEPLPGKPPDVPFGELFDRLSEKGGYYFSHNYVTNETSYLQVAGVLEARAERGRAYIGVGPEQNFTYVAITRPSIAFVVDIRRRNALLHLLYKAMFDEARSRTHFLALLLSRPWQEASDPGPGAGIDEVIAAVEKRAPEKTLREENHQRFLGRIQKQYGVKLKESDTQELRETEKAFFEGQLEIAFEVDVPNARKRAPLRTILMMADPVGHRLGFLAREESFRYVQRMQREHRIVPVVGDFAGSHAISAIAGYLKERSIPMSVFYVSNVEEYLLDGRVFRKWADNVAALPSDEKSLFLRAFLERKHHVHRAQQKGHRVASFVQQMAPFLARRQDKPYRNWVELAYDPPPLYEGGDHPPGSPAGAAPAAQATLSK